MLVTMRAAHILTLFLIHSSLSKNSPKFTVQIEKNEQCPGFENADITLDNITYVRVGRTGRGWDGVFVVHNPVPPEIKLKVLVKKCKTLQEQSCEHYVMANMDYCKVIQDKGQFYSEMFENTTPRIACPLQQQSYIFKNAILGANELFKILTLIPEGMSSYWRFQFMMTSKKESKAYFCTIFFFRIFEVRRQ